MFSAGLASCGAAVYLQVLVEADDGGGGEGQRQEVGEREPKPELSEDQQAHHRGHVCVTRAGLQRDGHVPATYGRGERERDTERGRRTGEREREDNHH